MNKLYAALTILLFLGVAGGGSVLSRMDTQRKWSSALASRQRLLEAELKLVRVELQQLAARPAAAVDVIARRRLEAMRVELLALVKRGKAEIEGSPEWAAWGFE